jgi:hypothetical protein
MMKNDDFFSLVSTPPLSMDPKLFELYETKFNCFQLFLPFS